MEDKYLETIMELSKKIGALEKENEYLKEELNKYKNKKPTIQEMRDKFMNIGKEDNLNNNSYTEEELDEICKNVQATFGNNKKPKKLASQRLNETLEKYRGNINE